jgi:hypothetical protein
MTISVAHVVSLLFRQCLRSPSKYPHDGEKLSRYYQNSLDLAETRHTPAKPPRGLNFPIKKNIAPGGIYVRHREL